MQKYGFTFKTVTSDEIKICLPPPSPKLLPFFPNLDYTVVL